MDVNSPLIGLVMPIIIDMVNQYIYSDKLKFVVSVIICLIVGVILNLETLAAGGISKVLESSALVFASAQIVYKLYYDKSGLRKSIF